MESNLSYPTIKCERNCCLLCSSVQCCLKWTEFEFRASYLCLTRPRFDCRGCLVPYNPRWSTHCFAATEAENRWWAFGCFAGELQSLGRQGRDCHRKNPISFIWRPSCQQRKAWQEKISVHEANISFGILHREQRASSPQATRMESLQLSDNLQCFRRDGGLRFRPQQTVSLPLLLNCEELHQQCLSPVGITCTTHAQIPN